jgi:hypothetical protein
LIYSIFGRKFRRTCVKLLCPCVSKSDYLWLAQTGGINQSEQYERKVIFQLYLETFVLFGFTWKFLYFSTLLGSFCAF